MPVWATQRICKLCTVCKIFKLYTIFNLYIPIDPQVSKLHIFVFWDPGWAAQDPLTGEGLKNCQKYKKCKRCCIFYLWISILELVLSIERIDCTVVSHVEHQIGEQLWKCWSVRQQSIYCAAVTSKVYLHCKDCVNIGHMRAWCWISLKIMSIGNKASRRI